MAAGITIGTRGMCTPADIAPVAGGNSRSWGRNRVHHPRGGRSVSSPDSVGRFRPGVGAVRLTRRGRVALLLFVGLCALAALGVFQLATAPQITSAPQQTLAMVPESQRTGTVLVKPGDSLWTIAERELGYMDPREAVVELRRANGITGGELVAGQRLHLPVR